MKLVEYLGRRLKDDEVMRLLERFDMRVVYQFDRLHENAPDYYDSAAPSNGFELRFDEAQILTTIFCYTVAEGPFAPIDESFIGLPIYRTAAEARAAGAKLGVKVSYAEGVRFLGRVMSWVRLDHSTQAWHFEYSGGALTRVSLMGRRAPIA
jgi:hypothetical protein